VIWPRRGRRAFDDSDAQQASKVVSAGTPRAR
jgi:hypothetical protein